MEQSDDKVLIFSFPLSGLVTTLLGPLLPVLTARWTLTDAEAGQLFLAQFLSSTLGALGSAWIMARLGISRSIALAYLAMAVAILPLGLLPHSIGLLSIAGYGLALGVSIPAVNLCVGLRSGSAESKVSRLNLLNMAWCLGAVFAPPVLVSILRAGGLGVALAAVSGLCLLAGAACFLLVPPAVAPPPSADRPGIARAIGVGAIAAGFFLFLYVGVENGLSGWLPLFAERVWHVRDSTAALALSVFWASILTARLAAASAARRLSPRRWILAGLAAALVGIGTLMFGGPTIVVTIGVAVAGLGLGPVFPTAVALFQDRAGAASARLIGFVFASAGCGGGALPWLIGAISSGSGSLRAGLAATLAAAAGMILTLGWL